MCNPPSGSRLTESDYELTVSPRDMDRYLVAINAVLLGDTIDHEVLREMRLRLRHSRRVQKPQEGDSL